MKNLSCIVLALFFWMSSLSVLAGDSSGIHVHPGKELVLSGHVAATGNFKVYLSANAVKIESVTNGGQVLACAPDWKVVAFRREEKIQWVSQLDRFSTDSINPLLFSPQTKMPVIKLPPNSLRVKSCGVDCVTCHYGARDQHCTIWLAETNLPAGGLEFYCRYFNFPLTGKFCLRSDARYSVRSTSPEQWKFQAAKDGVQRWGTFDSDLIPRTPDRSLQFEVKEIDEHQLQASDFEYPHGYQTKRNLVEIMSRSGSEGVEQTLDGLLDQSPAKAKPGK